MKQEALTQFPWPELALVPLIIFFIFFVGVIVWVNLKANKEKFGQVSLLPLEGEDHE
jgi:cbb3-type cytochrome oxidase subunit 3